MVGITAEHEQVTHADAADDVVFLCQDGECFGQFGGRGGRYVQSAAGDFAVFERLKPRHERQKGGFARAVGPNQRGDAALRDVEADVVEYGLPAYAVADVLDGYHCIILLFFRLFWDCFSDGLTTQKGRLKTSIVLFQIL